MKNSEVRIVPVAAVCDRRQMDSKPPNARWSVAAFVRKPQLDLRTPILHHSITPAQSSLIKPNRAISRIDAIQALPPAPSTASTPSMPSTNADRVRNPQSAIPYAHLLQRYSFAQIKPYKGG